MLNVLINMLVMVAVVLFVCAVCFIYCKSEKKREERGMGKDISDEAILTKMSMHVRYNGLSTRGRIN